MQFGKSTKSRSDYKEKIRIYKAKNLYRALLVIVAVVAVIIIVRVQYNGHVYTEYEVIGEYSRQKSADATDATLGDTILTYSKDGAHCSDVKGNVLWNQTYEIQDIKTAVSGNVVAIANYNGRDIYVLDSSKQLCSIQTTMPIRDIAVSESGVSTVVLYDTDAAYINTYDKNGEMIFSGQAHMSNSGYPAALALSPNGKLLEVSYIYVDAGTIKNTVAFYNFGDVGDNYADYLVSGFDYSDSIIPEVGFLDNDMSYAISDSRIIFFSGDEQPAAKAEYLLDAEVKSVFSSNGYVGLIFASDKAEYTYSMIIYDKNASKVGEYYFDTDYTSVFFEENDFVIYNESECLIKTYDGKDKFDGSFETNINLMLPTDKAYRYVIANDNTIQTIQLD